MSRSATARALLATRFPDALPAAQRGWSAVPVGIREFDRILPSGGFQRGRLTNWVPGVGAAALVRASCLHTVANGERAVWVDAAHTVAGACWCPAPILIRPPGATAALRATEELARSGGFALVVLDGVDPETGALVRLSRAAREGSAALVLLSRVTALATVRLTSRPLLGEYVWRRSLVGDADDLEAVRVRIEARASGWLAHQVFSLSLWRDDLRLSVDTGRPDRRGERR